MKQGIAILLICIVVMTGLVAGCASPAGNIASDQDAAKTVNDISKDIQEVSDSLGEVDQLFDK